MDATELGDLLELGNIDFVTGSEGAAFSGDLHDSADPRPGNQQALTWVAALGFDPKCDPSSDLHKIAKPRAYDYWKSYRPNLTPAWPGPLLDWRSSHPRTLAPVTARFLLSEEGDGPVLWLYRRILAAQNFTIPEQWHDVSVLNWPQNDYFEGEILNVTPEDRLLRFENARQLTLSLVYWLQNEAPRPDGGCGYSGLYLRPEATGTADGLAKYPYIREARRIKAIQTVSESDIGVKSRGGKLPDPVKNSVGIGYYRIDLHPTTGGDNFLDVESFPFQIPLGCLIPQEITNLIAAGKNIGTTHVANGCFRLHPVEWNIGEAAGALAGFCLANGCAPHDVASKPDLGMDLRRILLTLGIELEWPAAVYQEHLAQISKAP